MMLCIYVEGICNIRQQHSQGGAFVSTHLKIKPHLSMRCYESTSMWSHCETAAQAKRVDPQTVTFSDNYSFIAFIF